MLLPLPHGESRAEMREPPWLQSQGGSWPGFPDAPGPLAQMGPVFRIDNVSR